MEENKNLIEEEVVEEVKETTPETTPETKPDNTEIEQELFTELNRIMDKRSKSLAKSILKDKITDEAELEGVLTRYFAHNESAKNKQVEELTALQNKNNELTKKLFDIELNASATKVAAEIGLSADKLSYAMKLADMTNATKDGKIDNEALKSALSDVLNNIPEFKSKKTEDKPEAIVRKIGVEKTEPETVDAIDKIRKALGLSDNKN